MAEDEENGLAAFITGFVGFLPYRDTYAEVAVDFAFHE